VEALHRAGYETHVITLATGDDAKARREEILDGVHVHRLPLRRKKTSMVRYVYDYLSFTLLAGLKVAQLHLRHPLAAIQVNTMPDFLVFATLLPKLLGSKVVLMMHEPVPELWQTIRGKPPPRILALVEQAALAYADRVLTVTEQLKGAYVSRGADAAKISVILNVPEGRFLELDSGAAMKPDQAGRFTLICHGAIEERYGHDTILEAIAQVKHQIPHLRLRVLGHGSFLDEFLAQRSRLDLEDCVDYLGFVPLQQMLEELQAADVGIVAQKSSPYSNLVHTNKMYEYIHFGKPVLASRLKAVEAYFDDDSLCFFEPGDPESLAQGIVDLYRHPDKRRRLTENAQRLYNEYKWDQQRQIYLAIYHGLQV
jgi:glycosyltransferase involved in cell wall biosynthesis